MFFISIPERSNIYVYHFLSTKKQIYLICDTSYFLLDKEDKTMLDYEQVKARVNKETELLPSLFIKTGIGMIAAIVIAVFLFR